VGFEALLSAGAIRHWGVSNFDIADMTELLRVPRGTGAKTDQVLYNLADRDIDWELSPWAQSIGLPRSCAVPPTRSPAARE